MEDIDYEEYTYYCSVCENMFPSPDIMDATCPICGAWNCTRINTDAYNEQF